MSNYLEVIKVAALFFPFISFLISIPFILIEYHKFGSISFLKSFIIFSFIFYMLCAYFLVILPLPERSEVLLLTTPRFQLIPFKFIYDFIKEKAFVVSLFNILLTMPFAIYIRYYFKTDLKKTILYTFLLSLFFEITQLSGLYFLYPRSYRLFDIDDLFLNTLGGLLGYLIAPLIIKYLPERVKLEKESRIKGRNISGFKRLTSLLLDLFLYMIFSSICSIILNKIDFSIMGIISLVAYYVLIPYLLGGSTLGEKYLNLRIVDNNDKNNILKLFFRKLFFIISYIVVPICLVLFLMLFNNLNLVQNVKTILIIAYIIIVIVFYSIVFIKYIFTNKSMLYEKLSGTKMTSTIK